LTFQVVVLGKALIPRKFDPVRVFESLEAKLTILESLGTTAYSELIQQIAQSDDLARDTTVENHKKWKY
jgi:hypothetical protein